MKFKVTHYDNYFAQEIVEQEEVEYNCIEDLLDAYGVAEEHTKEVLETINSGAIVVYDEEGDKTLEPQFHTNEDMVFKVEEIK
jgi:hypothetical protein